MQTVILGLSNNLDTIKKLDIYFSKRVQSHLHPL